MNMMTDESEAVVPPRNGSAEKLAAFLKETRTDRRLRTSGKKNKLRRPGIRNFVLLVVVSLVLIAGVALIVIGLNDV